MKPLLMVLIICKKHRENIQNTGKHQGNQGISSLMKCGHPVYSFGTIEQTLEFMPQDVKKENYICRKYFQLNPNSLKHIVLNEISLGEVEMTNFIS